MLQSVIRGDIPAREFADYSIRTRRGREGLKIVKKGDVIIERPLRKKIVKITVIHSVKTGGDTNFELICNLPIRDRVSSQLSARLQRTGLWCRR